MSLSRESRSAALVAWEVCRYFGATGLFLKSVGHKRGIAGGFVVLAAAFTFLVSTAWATSPGANGRISYISGYDLHTVLPSGRDDKTIASPAYDSTWSPNGRWLAFTGFASDATGSDIFAIRAGGSDERRLTYYGNNNFGYGWTNTPSYSPGGGRIVFLSTAYHEHTSITTMRNDGSDWQYPLPYSTGAPATRSGLRTARSPTAKGGSATASGR